MQAKVIFAALFVTLLPVTLTGCLAQGTQPQGLHNAQLQNDATAPCTPSAANSLIATGRSLLDITNTLLDTQQSLSGNSTSTYAGRVKAAENTQRMNQGHDVLNNVEKLAGVTDAPCVADGSSASQ
jgi:hypothetical protein